MSNPLSVFRVATANASQKVPVKAPAVPAIHANGLDMEDQRQRIKAHRANQSRLWAEQHAPPQLTPAERKYAMHTAIVEANHYHSRIQSSALTKKLAKAIEERHPTGAPEALKVDPTSFRLSRSVIEQLFFDLDWIVDNYRNGDSVAQRALEEMAIWRL